MYDLIVYDSDVDEVEYFLEDYFEHQSSFNKIRGVDTDVYGDVIISLEDFETQEDLLFALRSEGFDAHEL